MERWFTTRDLSALALPGLPKDRSSLTCHLNRLSIFDCRARKHIAFLDYPGRRGRKPIAIHFLGLPRAARDEFFGRLLRGETS
jgi:hypothetical protein